MKCKLLTLVFAITLCLCSKAQSISPDLNSDYCPATEIIFTVTIPGTGYTGINVFGSTPVVPTVTLGPYNINTSTGNTVFNFKGKFVDFNNSQTLQFNTIIHREPKAQILLIKK